MQKFHANVFERTCRRLQQICRKNNISVLNARLGPMLSAVLYAMLGAVPTAVVSAMLGAMLNRPLGFPKVFT